MSGAGRDLRRFNYVCKVFTVHFNLLHPGYFCHLLVFFKINFFEKFFQEYFQCQIVLIQIRPDCLSTVCQSYQQTTLGNKELTNMGTHILQEILSLNPHIVFTLNSWKIKTKSVDPDHIPPATSTLVACSISNLIMEHALTWVKVQNFQNPEL